MKKLAIGCLIVVGVIGVALAVGGYLFYRNVVKPVASSFAQLQALPELDRRVTNTTSFTAPASGELTEEMVRRFTKVQEQLQGQLGTRLDELKVKYDQFEHGFKGEGTAGVTQVMDSLKDLAGVLVEAKRAQVQALNDAGFSLAEYKWVRQQVYGAAGLVSSGFDISEMVKNGGSSRGRIQTEAPAEVPERNKALIAPLRQQLEKWVPLAYFGL